MVKLVGNRQHMPCHSILIVDDEAVIADLSRISLGRLGHTVRCASTGEQAVKIARKKDFDLAVVSSHLPGMSGIETFEMMRQIKQNLIGIMITGHTCTDMVVRAMNKGFNGVVKKPFEADDLVTAVQEALAYAKLRDENTRLKTLLPLYKLSEKFMSAEKVEQVYEELLDAIVEEIQVPAVSLMMFDDEAKALRIVASRGVKEELITATRVKPGERIAGWVFERVKPVILNKSTQHQSPFANLLQRKEIIAAISYPVTRRGKAIGVINISQTRKKVAYSEADLEMLSIITAQAVMALENVTFLKEHENSIRMRALFEQYVSPEVAEVLVESQQNLLDVGGVQKITVFFADIRNFTLLVQRLPLVQLREFLNAFFNIFTDVVFSHRGTLDKFMGDAALVIFGAPIEIENASEAAVEAAIHIVVKFEELRKKWIKTSNLFEKIGLGIGISRGDMFLGNVGSSRRLDYTVIGTDVNIAQRLAAVTTSGQILITESVRNELGDTFELNVEENRLLKGLEKELSLYSVEPQV